MFMERLQHHEINFTVMDQSFKTVKDRIDWALKRSDMTQARLAEWLHIKPQTIQHWKTRDSIPADRAEAAARVLRVDPAWLRKGVGGPTNRNEVREAEFAEVDRLYAWETLPPDDADHISLEVLDVELSAGNGNGSEGEHPTGRLPFQRRILRENGVSAKDARIVQVIGNSMSPVMENGDTVGVDTADTHPIIDGMPYAVRDIELLRVKLLYALPGGGLRLKSYNSEEFPDETLGPEERAERINIVGRVFWSSRMWKRRR